MRAFKVGQTVRRLKDDPAGGLTVGQLCTVISFVPMAVRVAESDWGYNPANFKALTDDNNSSEVNDG